MERIIGYTTGLLCKGSGRTQLVKVEISQRDDLYCLQAVNGWNLAPLRGSATLTPEEYGRLASEQDGILHALERLEECGWMAVSLD